MRLEISLVVLFWVILFYNILFNTGIVEGLTDGKDEYYNLTKQKYKINNLNEIFNERLKEFDKFKEQVHNHSKFMVKHLGKTLGIHKE